MSARPERRAPPRGDADVDCRGEAAACRGEAADCRGEAADCRGETLGDLAVRRPSVASPGTATRGADGGGGSARDARGLVFAASSADASEL